MRSWPLAALVLVSSSVLGAAPGKNVELERGKKSLEEFRYAEAGKSFDIAWLVPGTDFQTVLEIIKLQAVVAATLGQQERARSLFRTLLYLAPNFELPEGDLGPRVLSLYYEARGRVAVEGALKVVPGPIVRDDKRVQKISIKVGDSQKLGKKVRFHSRPPVLLWSEVEVPLVESQASLSVDGAAFDYWAELLGDKDRVLAQLGSADQPLRAERAPSLFPEDPSTGLISGSARPRGLKTVAYIAAGAGLVAAIPGLVFGIRSNSLKNEILSAMRDSSGRVTGITRERALQLNELQRSSGAIANSLFVTSAVLIGAGVALYVLSPDTEVKVSALPGGVVVAGTFP